MATVKLGQRGGGDPGEGLAGLALDLIDPRHRITGGETPPQAGGHQQVALRQVGIVGDVGQIELIDQPRAPGHGAQSVAVDPHRQAMGGIADEQDGGRGRADPDHLAHDGLSIQDRLADEDPRGATLVDQHLMTVGVQIHGQEFRDQDPLPHPKGRPQQVMKAAVFGLQGLQALQPPLEGQILSLEAGMVLAQGGLGGEAVPDGPDHRVGQVGEIVQGGHQQGQGRAQRLQQVLTLIGHHEADGEEDRDYYPVSGRGPAQKQWFDRASLVLN